MVPAAIRSPECDVIVIGAGCNIRTRVTGYTTHVRNLFIGGQWAELGGGLPVAVRAGMNSALLILKKESPEEFRAICEAVDAGRRIN